MKIESIKAYTTKKTISFRESEDSIHNNAELMLQTPNAALNFAKDHYISAQADSINSNPITSLGYKLYRTFGILTNHETPKDNSNNKFSVVA